MEDKRKLQEMKAMLFVQVYESWRDSRLNQEDAAVLLGMSVRTFRRHCRQYESDGFDGLGDRRVFHAAHNAAPVDEVMEVLSLFESKYSTFSVSHFYDKYRGQHKGQRSYNWVRRCLQDGGLARVGKKGGKHRRRRERAPMAGMLIHQDGSTHEWVPGSMWDLIVTLDDATSEVYSGFFVPEEGTHSSFQGVEEVIKTRGLFCSFYSDRGSHYWSTPTVGGKVDKNNLTQFGRAMKQLGIEMIPAYSPEARGRSERQFGTLQQRLVKELALEGITDMGKANCFLKDVFWSEYNARFSVKPCDEESAFVPWIDSARNLQDILCIQEQRTVRKDNTVSYNSKLLQIPKQADRYYYAKTKVMVHEYMDDTIGIFHGPRRLALFDAKGHLIQTGGAC